MKILICIFSFLLIENTISFKISSANRNLQARFSKDLSTKIREVEIREFVIDKFCGGYDSFGLCSMCYNSYLDFNTKRCVSIDKKIPNCLSYDQNNLCMVCEFGYRISGKGDACKPNKDPNCLVENSMECEVRPCVYFQFYEVK